MRLAKETRLAGECSLGDRVELPQLVASRSLYPPKRRRAQKTFTFARGPRRESVQRASDIECKADRERVCGPDEPQSVEMSAFVRGLNYDNIDERAVFTGAAAV